MFLVLAGIVYLLIIFVLSIKEKEIEFSEFEIQRRISAGEKRFEKILLKKQIIPVYNRALNFISVFLAVIMSLLNSQIFSFKDAMLMTFGFILLAFILSRTDFMRFLAHKIFVKISPKLYFIWNSLSLKNRKRILKLNQKSGWMFYSKAEMFDFLSHHKQIASEHELNWFKRISSLSEKKVSDFEICRNSLDILHEKDLLTPLVIDELFKSKQSVFVVMDEDDIEVLGVVKMTIIGEIGIDSKRVRTVMERDFRVIRGDKSALEAFEKMVKDGDKFAIVKNRKGEFSGILSVEDFLR